MVKASWMIRRVKRPFYEVDISRKVINSHLKTKLRFITRHLKIPEVELVAIEFQGIGKRCAANPVHAVDLGWTGVIRIDSEGNKPYS